MFWRARPRGWWLAGLTGQAQLRAGDFLGLTAEHLEQADDAARAAEFHARAAEQAGLRWRLLSAQENSLDLQGRRDEQAADLEALAQLAEQLGNDQRRAEVARRRALGAMRMADWAAMESAARHGMACATAAGHQALRLHAVRLLTSAQMNQGQVEAARDLARSAPEIAVAAKARHVEARAGMALGDAEGALGRAAAAREALAQVRSRALDSDDPLQLIPHHREMVAAWSKGPDAPS